MLRKILTISALLLGGWWLLDREQRRAVPYDLRGKVVVITGASKGIGAALVRAFAKSGAHLALVARSPEALKAVADEIAPLVADHAPKPLIVRADVTDDEQLNAIPDVILSHFGRVDVLINNAGLTMGGRLTEYDAAQMRQLINLNVYGLMRLTQLLLPAIQQAGDGVIVNMSSVAGGVYAPGHSVYSASKAAVHGFSEALRRELSDDGVHVIEFKPGWVDTGMTDRMNREQMEKMMFVSPATPFYTAEEMAERVVDAVRYREREAIEGGPGFRFFVFLQRLFPRALDLGFTRLVDSKDVVDMMKKQGQG